MDLVILIFGIFLLIVSIVLLYNKKPEKYNERKSASIVSFILGIMFIILAFISNRKLFYLIFGLTFIGISIWDLYLKKKNPENTKSIISNLIFISLGILYLIRAFIE